VSAYNSDARQPQSAAEGASSPYTGIDERLVVCLPGKEE
jgi:hypothetical protein